MDSIDKLDVGSMNPLISDIKLKDLIKDESMECTSSSAGKGRSKASLSKLTSSTKSTLGDNYGYLYIDKKEDEVKVSTFTGNSTESSSIYDVPRKTDAVPMSENSLTTGSLATPEIPTPDKSHYDVPKKLLQEAKVLKKLGLCHC